MKTWIKRTLIGLFGAGVLFGGLAACSHRGHHSVGWHQMSEEDAAKMKIRIVERAAGKLDLDEAQKAKLGIVADKLREQRNALIGTTTDPRAELRALVAGPSFDRDKARALIESKTAAVQTKSPDVITALADFYDSLKPEQQAKLRGYLDQGRRHWRG
jgi:protein CpxP